MPEYSIEQQRALAIAEAKAKLAAQGATSQIPPMQQASNGGLFNDIRSAWTGGPDPAAKRFAFLPLARDQDGTRRMGAPGFLYDTVQAMSDPGRVARGQMDPQQAANNVVSAFTGTSAATIAAKPVIKAGMEVAGSPAVSELVARTGQEISERAPWNTEAAVRRELTQAATDRNMSPTMVEARVAELGPKATVADALPELGEKFANRPGTQRTSAVQMVEPRQAEQFQRVGGIFDKFLDSRDYGGTFEALEKGRSAASREPYAKLYQRYDNISTPYLERIQTDEPLVKQGLKAAYEIQRIRHNSDPEAGAFDPRAYGVIDFNAAGDPIIGKITSLEQWNSVKMGLDAILNSGDAKVIDQLTGNYTRYGDAVNKFRKSLVGTLDKLAPGDPALGIPSYGDTRAIWAGPSQAMEMMQRGQDFIKKDKSSLDIDEFNKLSPADKDYVRLGAKQALYDITLGTPKGADAVKRVFGTPLIEKKLQALLGSDGEFGQMKRLFDGESVMFDNNTNFLKNSRTGLRGMLQGDNRTGFLQGAFKAITEPVATAKGLGQAAVDKLSSPSQAFADQIGLIYSQNPADQKKLFDLMRQRELQAYLRTNRPNLSITGGPNQ